MKTAILVLVALVLGGCYNYVHMESCVPQKDGFSHCKHYIEYETEPAAIGTFQHKG